ncbi:hypothetical protein CDA63_11695 [Hymenobacter amundsenii]|uniref:Uncharacterized protein n=1 Tax=Hymenobacter amundsenii TaxID=2006685 RepID=A0A246FJW9_9BACT|nr:hypothetical protein [Hymenobacter amundsenii]OWP62874.1 hypothetical protein CDA63_11695 [Hymenobacter amundsenii]
MIRFENAAGVLDLSENTTISLEIQSPLFRFDSVPGTTSYSFSVPWTPGNLRRLNFPHLRAAQGETIAPEPYDCYIDEVLWRRGSLLYKEADEQKRVWSYTFAADAADLQARIAGRTLRQLELGRVLLELRPDAAAYALPTMHHPQFYGGKNKPFEQAGGLVNDYRNGVYRTNTPAAWQYPIVPFPRLVYLLRAVFGALGYQVEGEWLADAAQLVCYSDRAVEVLAAPNDPVPVLPADFALAEHVPDMGVGEFLVSLQKLFGLMFLFHPVRPRVRIGRLRDVVAEPGYLERTAGPGRLSPALGGGFLLKMALADDELNKTLDTSWAQLRIGAGQTTIDSAAGTLHMVVATDPADNSRRHVPGILAKGSSPAFEAGLESRAGLHLLYDFGVTADQDGQTYPLASSASPDPDRLPGLDWPDLYFHQYSAWLGFLDRAGSEQRTASFRVADLLALDPARKELVNYRKYLWEKVSVSLNTSRRLESARFTYRPIRL